MAGKTAVFNGEEVILEETDWYLLDLFRLWWRYGISFIRLQMWVEEIMEKFMRWDIKYCLLVQGTVGVLLDASVVQLKQAVCFVQLHWLPCVQNLDITLKNCM